jgi:hypothetical protein
MLGSRAIWDKGWKAMAVHPAAPSAWSHFAEDRWELYNTETDRTEMHDLAGQYPEKARELVDLWYHEAGRYHGLPLDDRTALEILLEDRPQLAAPRERYTYYPGISEVPEASAVNIRNRSFTIAAEVNCRRQGKRRPVCARLTLWWPRPVPQRGHLAIRVQLLRHHRAAGGGVVAGHKGRRDTGSLVREGRQ